MITQRDYYPGSGKPDGVKLFFVSFVPDGVKTPPPGKFVKQAVCERIFMGFGSLKILNVRYAFR